MKQTIKVQVLTDWKDVTLKKYLDMMGDIEAYKDDEDNTHRAFTMAKQDEIAQEMNKKFNGSFLKFLQ